MFDGPVGGVDGSVGSPEAARASRLDPDGPPGPRDPQDRPGCGRVALTMLLFVGAVVLVLWLAGEVARTL
jgi:hypothetical protein